jgi:hypothetical protein
MMYLNQFRAVKCFPDKTAMMGNVIVVPQSMKCVFRVLSLKRVENHCSKGTTDFQSCKS